MSHTSPPITSIKVGYWTMLARLIFTVSLTPPMCVGAHLLYSQTFLLYYHWKKKKKCCQPIKEKQPTTARIKIKKITRMLWG